MYIQCNVNLHYAKGANHCAGRIGAPNIYIKQNVYLDDDAIRDSNLQRINLEIIRLKREKRDKLSLMNFKSVVSKKIKVQCSAYLI